MIPPPGLSRRRLAWQGGPTGARIAEAACGILATAQTALAALQEPPGSRTAEMIDEAVAWIDEQRASIRVAAEREAQDL